MCLEQASDEMQHKTYSSAVAKVQCVSRLRDESRV